MICPTCNKEFEGQKTGRHAIYCSVVCREKAFRVRHGMRPHPPKVAKTCEQCGKEFQVSASHAKRRTTCSKKCYFEWRRGKHFTPPGMTRCEHCGIEYARRAGNDKFCSPKCRDAQIEGKCEVCGQSFFMKASDEWRRRTCSTKCAGALRGKEADKGGSVTRYGYRILHRGGDRILEHRYVMEQHLGRTLHPWENVHHRDGNRLNNALDNLELWVVKQPPGQRAEDLIPWMVDYLSANSTEISSEGIGMLIRLLASLGYDVVALSKQWLEGQGYVVTKQTDPSLPLRGELNAGS